MQLSPKVCGPLLLAKNTRMLTCPHVNMEEGSSSVCKRRGGGGGRGSGRWCRRPGRGVYHVAREPSREKSKLHSWTKA